MGKRLDIQEGERYNKLTIINEVDQRGGRRFLCQCDCGEYTEVLLGNLRSGAINSCGCLATEVLVKRNYKHGCYTKQPKFFTTWIGMHSRCCNPTNPDYHYYGGRGIKIWPAWGNNPNLFIDYISQLDHAGEKGYTIDRINNTGNYEPSNIRWATQSDQSRNARKPVSISGYVGVYKVENKWAATINNEGTRHWLGYFPTPELGVEARNRYIIEHNLHGYKIQ